MHGLTRAQFDVFIPFSILSIGPHPALHCDVFTTHLTINRMDEAKIPVENHVALLMFLLLRVLLVVRLFVLPKVLDPLV